MVSMSEENWFFWFNLLTHHVPEAYASTINGDIISSIAVQVQEPSASASVATSLPVEQSCMSTVAIEVEHVLEMDLLVASMGALYSASFHYDLYLGQLVLGQLNIQQHVAQAADPEVWSRTWIVFLPDHEKFKDTDDDVPGDGALLAYATYVVFIDELERWCAKQTKKCNLTVFVAAPRCDKTLIAVQKRLQGFSSA